MSPIEEKDNRQRSVKLCQLVYDRKIDKKRAVGFEIRKLLAAGVLIDYQSKDRSKKTALHLAVENRDVICVKFLLKHKPNLEVKDEDGKTPVDLAKSNGFQKILNVLLDSTVDVVNESYVEVIDFRSLTSQKIEAIKSRSTFKVLKLTNCPNAKTVWNKLNDRAYTKALNESSHLFFIAIETNIQNDHKRMKSLNLRRPMIVQLTSSNSRKPKVYFKDEKNDFVEITDTTQITQEEFHVAVQAGGKCNMKLLVEALRLNLFGSFNGDLLSTKLNTNEDRNEAVNQFAKSNALCHRFFKLFDEILVDESHEQIERFVATLSFKGDQSLLALLDLPFEPNHEKLELNEDQQDILSALDFTGNNFLMTAVQKENFGLVKLLLRCGCDFNYGDDGNRTSDICWEMKASDCLAELIEAGSPYPNYFCLDEIDESSEAHGKISKMVEATNSFHENIKQGKTEKVKKFIASHPNIKHAFDTNNKCALTVALQSNQVDIYSLLMSKGFEPGADYDEYQSACSESRFKNEIRNSHKKYFKEAFDEPHLKRLFKMFRLSFGSKNRAKCSTIIRKMFEELNEIDELIPILKICSLSDKLQIVFDFNCKSVVEMDPTEKLGSSGAVYPYDGFIYVGAKNHEKEFFAVIGTLIHELTHFAMELTYGNNCRPYKIVDIKTTKRFGKIAKATKKICDKNSSTDSIVATVFTCYKQIVWHQELIVRVPQLLAHYKMNHQTLKAAERNTPELFHFYCEKTLKDVEARSKVLLQEYLIGKSNNQTGIARKIEKMKVKFKNVAIDLKPSVYVITSNAPQFTLAMLKQFDCDNSDIFVSLEQVATGNILEKIVKVNARESSTSLIVDCIVQAQKYQESLGKLMKSMKNIKTVVLVMTEAEGSKVKENFPKVEFKTLTHKWAELTESSKVHLLDQNVNFQGVEMKLNELVEPSSNEMNFFPLGELVDCKDFKIGSELRQTSHKFYIPRKFIQKGQASPRSFEELLQIESRMGSMIISDEAGSGKSVALFEIAKRLHIAFPHRWVLFVDLKRHIEAFKSVEDHEKIESVEDFILQNILKNVPEFDRKLFMQMFRTGKTFVLFDGFDEISPNYKDLLLHVLKSFQPESGNQVFVTTRPHLETDLEGALGEFVFEIEELSRVDQIDFLSKYFQSVKFEMSHDDLEVLSDRLFDKFSKIATSNIIGLPLLMRMTAEIFDDAIKENLMQKVDSLNVSSVFRKFVEKYFARWTNNENEISRKETVEFVMAGGVFEVHHKIALNHIFNEEFMSLDVDESDAEKISRVGLIRYDKAEKTFQFIHETFAEYFVADFIWFHLNRKNRDPSHDCNKAVEILIEVFLSGGFGVIKTFLDQTLEVKNFNPSESFCKSVAKCLSEIVKSNDSFDFLSIDVFDSRKHLESLLLSIVKQVEKEVLLEMLQAKGLYEDTALLRAADYGSKATISTLCDIITTRTDKPKEIFQNVGRLGNVLFYAARNENAGVLTTLCDNLNSVLTRDEIKILFQQTKYGTTIIETAINDDDDEVFLELISLLPKYFSPDEIKSLLLAVDRNQNFFHRALTDDTSESLKVKFDVIKSNFNDEEQIISFYKPSAGPNMFHCAAQNRNEKIFETLIEYTLDVLSGDEIKSMLMQKEANSGGSNVLHRIARLGDEIKLNELNLVFREHLSDDEIRSLLLEVNGEGQNCFRLATNNSKLGFKVFGEIIGNLLPFEDQTRLLQESIHEIDIIRLVRESYTKEFVSLEAIKQLLTKKGVFHKIAKRGNFKEWNKLISFAQARFSADEMKSFLFCVNEDGDNCLHLAVSSWSHGNMIGVMFKTIKAVLSVEDQKNFVRQKDSSNRNLFHHAVENRWNKSNLFALFDDLSAILSNDEIKEMLKEKDSEGDNIFGFPTTLGEISLYLISFLQKVLTYDELKNFLLDVNRKGENTFSCAVGSSSKSKIKSSSEVIKGVLSRDDQKFFFGIKSPSVFHLAVKNEESGIFSTLYECLKDVFDADELKTLAIGSDNDGRNILHLAAQGRDQLILKKN